MKIILKYIGILLSSSLFLLSCQKELEIDTPDLLPSSSEKVTITLVPTLGAEVLQETEIMPMTRGQNRVRTRLINRYQTVIIKKTDNKWIIDTLIKGKINPDLKDQYIPSIINVYDTLSLPPLRLALRPGKYKAGFFLNANAQNWNPNLKPGYIVSQKADITPDDDLPVAYTYKIQEDSTFQNYKCTMLNEEPFAAWTSFSIEKNDSLQQNKPAPKQILSLKRRATRFRYLLKDTSVNITINNDKFQMVFENTNYFFKADFNVPKETPFCQGLNILGGGYYPKDSLCTTLKIYISTSGNLYSSPEDHHKYQMAIPVNSTYRSYYILMDEYYPQGVECTISNIKLSGASQRPNFIYDGNITMNFRLNHISGVIFEPSPREAAIINGYNSTFYIERNTEADAVKLFDPFFELNPKQ